VWQRGIDLAVEIYMITKFLPKEERYGLSSQMRRAAVSIPANVAEGHAREGLLDYIRFLGLSRGSVAELDTHLEIVRRLDYVTDTQLERSWRFVDEVRSKLVSLQYSLRRSAASTSSRR